MIKLSVISLSTIIIFSDYPFNSQIWHQSPGSVTAELLIDLHHYVIFYVILILFVVLVLLFQAIVTRPYNTLALVPFIVSKTGNFLNAIAEFPRMHKYDIPSWWPKDINIPYSIAIHPIWNAVIYVQDLFYDLFLLFFGPFLYIGFICVHYREIPAFLRLLLKFLRLWVRGFIVQTSFKIWAYLWFLGTVYPWLKIFFNTLNQLNWVCFNFILQLSRNLDYDFKISKFNIYGFLLYTAKTDPEFTSVFEELCYITAKETNLAWRYWLFLATRTVSFVAYYRFRVNTGEYSAAHMTYVQTGFFGKKETTVWYKMVVSNIDRLCRINNAKFYRLITHSWILEIFWTLLPSLILLVIAIPSLFVLYMIDEPAGYVLTVFKVIGHQWYWSYEIGDCSIAAFRASNYKFPSAQSSFDSFMLPVDELIPGQLRLLEVDNSLVIPSEVPLVFVITADDVLHSWAVPSLGIKVDAVPGRLNQVYCFVTRCGEFYGQCSELCGVHHGFMPIHILST